jgi:hypothetical protein
MHAETVMEQVLYYTWRLWSSEIGWVLGGTQSRGSWWEAHCMLTLNSSVSELETVGMWPGDNIFEALMECWLVEVNANGGTLDDEAEFRGQLVIIKRKGWSTILCECCNWCILYSVYIALSVYCTWCMLYLVYATLGVCGTWCMLHLVNAGLGVCCTWYILHLVDASQDVYFTRCMLHWVNAALGVYWILCILSPK